MYGAWEEGCVGRLVAVIKMLEEANHPELLNYDPEKPIKKVDYIDINNLYVSSIVVITTSEGMSILELKMLIKRLKSFNFLTFQGWAMKQSLPVVDFKYLDKDGIQSLKDFILAGRYTEWNEKFAYQEVCNGRAKTRVTTCKSHSNSQNTFIPSLTSGHY